VQAADPCQLLLDRADGGGRVEGDAVSVPLPRPHGHLAPFGIQIVHAQAQRLMGRSPPPYRSKATVRAGPRVAARRFRTSALDRTTGRCFGVRARTTGEVFPSIASGRRRT